MISELANVYTDSFDKALYDEAKSIFKRNLQLYNVTRERCMETICPELQSSFSNLPVQH